MNKNGECITFLVTSVVFVVGSDLGTFFERKLSQSIIDNNALPPNLSLPYTISTQIYANQLQNTSKISTDFDK